MHISGTYSASEQSVQLELGEEKEEDYSSLNYSSESYGHSQLDFMTPDSSRDEETHGVNGDRE